MLAEDLISRYLEGSDDTLSSVKSLIKKWRMRLLIQSSKEWVGQVVLLKLKCLQ